MLRQLPPQQKKDLPRLLSFLEALPRGLRHVVEFRNREWLSDDVYDALDRLSVSLCLHDLLPRAKQPVNPPGPLDYRRLHGPRGTYRGRYGTAKLRRPAAEMVVHAQQGRDCFAYFNNDRDAHAVFDALQLRSLVLAGLASSSSETAPIHDAP